MDQIRPAVMPFFTGQYSPAHIQQGLQMERLRFPGQHPMFAAMFQGAMPPAAHMTPPQSLPPRVAAPSPCFPGGGLCFSQDELDMVLYGYAKGRPGEHCHGHALSGLRIGDLSHGSRPVFPPFNEADGDTNPITRVLLAHKEVGIVQESTNESTPLELSAIDLIISEPAATARFNGQARSRLINN